MNILAIDPGNIESAYAVLDEQLKPIEFGKVENYRMLDVIDKWGETINHFAIECVASYGMAVGQEIFETCIWIGRFIERAECKLDYEYQYIQKIYRKDVKINLCGSMKAKDANIRQSLIDRFGIVGTKKEKGWFYGVSKDVWSAVAVGITYYDMYLKGDKP
jgi:hypothetical protein